MRARAEAFSCRETEYLKAVGRVAAIVAQARHDPGRGADPDHGGVFADVVQGFDASAAVDQCGEAGVSDTAEREAGEGVWS